MFLWSSKIYDVSYCPTFLFYQREAGQLMKRWVEDRVFSETNKKLMNSPGFGSSSSIRIILLLFIYRSIYAHLCEKKKLGLGDENGET